MFCLRSIGCEMCVDFFSCFHEMIKNKKVTFWFLTLVFNIYLNHHFTYLACMHFFLTTYISHFICLPSALNNEVLNFSVFPVSARAVLNCECSLLILEIMIWQNDHIITWWHVERFGKRWKKACETILSKKYLLDASYFKKWRSYHFGSVPSPILVQYYTVRVQFPFHGFF